MSQEPRGGDSRFTRPCTIKGHEVTRRFGNVVDGKVEVDCICWTCNETDTDDDRFTHAWVELWRFDRVVQDNEPPMK